MRQRDWYIFKSKCILSLSCFLLIIAVGFESGEILNFKNSVETTSINITQMSKATNTNKTGNVLISKKLIEVTNEEIKNDNKEVINIFNPVNTKTWYLPTEFGMISQYPSYYHTAYDITSPRGTAEIIYPVAAGEISNIYYDNAGALIVTVRHYIDGRFYSSQYAHLSRFADISIGQQVTPNTPLGWMGSTGMSTGVHLHLAVMDCNMFGNTDTCADLNGYFNYARQRVSEGFVGLGNLTEVPYQWYSR